MWVADAVSLMAMPAPEPAECGAERSLKAAGSALAAAETSGAGLVEVAVLVEVGEGLGEEFGAGPAVLGDGGVVDLDELQRDRVQDDHGERVVLEEHAEGGFVAPLRRSPRRGAP